MIEDIVDSGATHHMRENKDDFEHISEIKDENGRYPLVELGDGSYLEIRGEGYVHRRIGKHTIRYHAYWVPGLSASLYSVKQHVRKQGCFFHSEDNQAVLAFPKFTVNLTMDPEISMMTMKEPTSTEVSDFDEQHAKSCKTYWSMKLSMVNPTWIQDHIYTSIKHAFKCTSYIKKAHPKANLPSQGTIESMGYDFTNIHGTTIEPHSTNRIRTGLMCTSPKGTYIRIAPRSRLATKGITVQGGVIDPDYRGEIEVILHNSTSEAYNIAPAQKIAQFILEQAHTPMIVLTEKLDTTTRANKGFGSTGR